MPDDILRELFQIASIRINKLKYSFYLYIPPAYANFQLKRLIMTNL